MTVSGISAAASTTQSAAPASSSLTSDYQTFLKLMTTQLQYQDPMNPVDSTEYLSQLASFSAVEQQTQTNKLLTSMQASFNMLGMAQVASWVGSEGRAAMPALVADGGRLSLTPQIAPEADQAVLLVRDSAGKLVSRVDIPVNAKTYDWLPLDATGATLADGLYDLEVENYKDGAQISTTEVELYGKIQEIRGLSGEMTLVMEGGREVAASAVTAIRGA